MSSADWKQQLRQRWKPVAHWYQSREPREQKVLQVLGVVLVLVMLYWLIWAPAVNGRNDARRQYVTNMQTHNWIEANASAVRAAATGGSRQRLPANWVSEVSRSANDYGLTLKGFSPDGTRAVRIQLEEQPAGQTILWLQSLQEKGVQLSNLEMTPGNSSGTATVRATLQQ